MSPSLIHIRDRDGHLIGVIRKPLDQADDRLHDALAKALSERGLRLVGIEAVGVPLRSRNEDPADESVVAVTVGDEVDERPKYKTWRDVCSGFEAFSEPGFLGCLRHGDVLIPIFFREEDQAKWLCGPNPPEAA